MSKMSFDFLLCFRVKSSLTVHEKLAKDLDVTSNFCVPLPRTWVLHIL